MDTETTAFSPAFGARIVEIAIVDRSGRALVDTLIDPGSEIPWQSTKIHGITDDMVRGKPKLGQIMPPVLQAITGSRVVIYNARFDTAFFPDGLQQADGIECAMAAFARALGYPVRKLSAAADHVGHQWSGQAHRALADALACRSIWLWLSETASVRYCVSNNSQSSRSVWDTCSGKGIPGEASAPATTPEIHAKSAASA